ncbi:Intraflagellar transport protein 27, partial [Rhizophlyctis rosea]
MPIPSEKTILRTKCVVLGAQSTGKSALLERFHSDGASYPKPYTMTLHADLLVKSVNIPETNVAVEMYFVDVGGWEGFEGEIGKYAEGATSFMIVFDPSHLESFKGVAKYLGVLRKGRGGKGVPGILISAKSDLPPVRRLVSHQQAQEFAKQHGLGCFETSAATNSDVEAPFYYLANAFYEAHLDEVGGRG